MFILMAGVVVFLLLLASTSGRASPQAMAEAFEGEVIRRHSKQVTLTTGMRTDYWLDIRTDDGELRSITLPWRIWGRFEAGERIVKRAGERWPST
ncbi:DUF7489 domain-containing protein [Streptomyces goshikiensis]|uniref:DUF7489 domain-containing protein n=1 Tax=Streptomyces goshikiensis TaxID=1942 RepID=UPI0036B6ED77